MSRKNGFQEPHGNRTIYGLGYEQFCQDFFGIWQHIQVKLTCMIFARQTGQIHARLPAQLLKTGDSSLHQASK
jgi:hypothetical protein